MTPKKNKKIPQNVSLVQNKIPLKAGELSKDIFKGNPYIVLKHFQPDHQCFSDWDKNQLKKFSKLVKQFKETKWHDIMCFKKFQYDSIKNYNKEKFPKYNKISNELSKELIEISLIHFGFDSGERIFGFRLDDAFYLLLLDKDHKMFKCTT